MMFRVGYLYIAVLELYCYFEFENRDKSLYSNNDLSNVYIINI